MNTGQTVFAQIMQHIPMHEFKKCVTKYNGDYRTRTFSCLDQFLCMAFAQLTQRDSLRNIEVCLRTQKNKLYHMGIRGAVSKSTLADANDRRDWRIFADFAHILISLAREIYHDDGFAVDLANTAYALDSSTVDLCLSMFPWAHFRKTKGAIKLHTLLDLRGNIPSFIQITTGKVHDVNILDQLVFEAGSFYIMDRGYLDFKRLFNITLQSAFFITRSKSNLAFNRLHSFAVDKTEGLRCDQTVNLSNFYAHKDYPDKLRRIRFFDAKNQKSLVFLTNNFSLPALTIAQLYKQRWQVELFFKWIKQHLHIKTFYGTSENAVKTQVWIAIAVYVLVAIMKKQLKMNQSLYMILQVISISIFDKTHILQALEGDLQNNIENQIHNQLNLFNC